MKTWRKPAINIYDVKMDENIASSGLRSVTDWIGFTATVGAGMKFQIYGSQNAMISLWFTWHVYW